MGALIGALYLAVTGPNFWVIFACCLLAGWIGMMVGWVLCAIMIANKYSGCTPADDDLSDDHTSNPMSKLNFPYCNQGTSSFPDLGKPPA